MADIDEIVGNHTEADPTLHSGIAFVLAAVEPVPPLGRADAALAPGPPFLVNQRFFCSRLRSGLLVERLGMQTRLTPWEFAAASFLAE